MSSALAFAVVANKNVWEELRIMLISLRAYHGGTVYLLCDDETKELVQNENITNVEFLCTANPENLLEIKQKFFNRPSHEMWQHCATHTHSAEMIYCKMDCLEWALSKEDQVLFLDADIVFLRKFPVEELAKDTEVALSPHFQKATFDERYGKFNAGYLYCTSKTFPSWWRNAYLTDSKYYEQHCMNNIPALYRTEILNKEHNVGFWRITNQEANLPRFNLDALKKALGFEVKNSIIYIENKPVVAIHTHLFGPKTKFTYYKLFNTVIKSLAQEAGLQEPKEVLKAICK